MKLTTPNSVTLSENSLYTLSMSTAWLWRNFRDVTAHTNRFLLNSLQVRIPLAFQAVANGILGDSLAAAKHSLAIPMAFRVNGQPLKLERQALISAIPEIHSKQIVLVHGLSYERLRLARRVVG